MARVQFIVCLSLLIASAAFSQDPPATKSQANKAISLSMPMVAPLFLEDNDFSSTVTLANDAIAKTRARIVVLDSHGVQAAYREVEMAGHTSLAVQIHDLLAEAGSAVNTGSVLVIPEPVAGMPIGAQLSIASRTGATPAYIEEEMLSPDEGRQGMYRVTALNVKGSPIIALKSLGQGTQSVTLECFAEKGAPTKGTVQLLAGDLLLVTACDASKTGRTTITEQMYRDESLPDRGAVGVSITTTGTPGDLIAYGFAVYRDERGPYFSSLNLTNPTVQTSSNTIYTGVPTGPADLFPGTTFRPEVAISNFSTKSAEVRVTLAHTIGGKTFTELVQKLALAGHSSKTVQIPAHGDPAMTNSLMVRSSLPPGEVVAQFVAWGDAAVRTVELQAKDNDSPQNGGGHPWSIEPGTTSTLLLFNHSEGATRRFNVLIGTEKQQWQRSYYLASMETKAISINEIVEKQVADEKGHMLPKDAVTGQVSWFTRSPKWGKGRLMVSQPQTGLARSFSCGICSDVCPGAFLDPYTLLFTQAGQVGDLGDIMASLCTHTCTPPTCGGTNIGQTTDVLYTWSSLNTSIATVSGGAHASRAAFLGGSTGSTYGKATAQGDFCTAQAQGPINVVRLTCTPSAVTRAGSVSCTVTAPGGSTFSNWKFSDGSGNTVTGNGTSSTWSGVMVTSGAVSVTVKDSSGNITTPSQPITVNSRTNFAFSAVSPSPEANNFNGDGCTISVPSPPQLSGDAVGKFCLAQYFSFNTATIGDNGPNNGYSYVTSITSSSGGSSTNYFYVISPDLQNTSSTFYKAQCGNYNATAKAGFISGANLLSDATRHESGTIESHYENYVIAQNNSSNNLGTVAEATTGLEAAQTLANGLTSTLNQSTGTILSATQVEPCGVQYDTSCNFQGCINFSPYHLCSEVVSCVP